MGDDLNGYVIPLRTSQPPKVKKRRLKTLETRTFQTTLKTARAMKKKISIAEMCESQSEIQVKTRQSHTRRNIKITNEKNL